MKKALLLLFLTVANIASVGQSNSIKPTKTQLLAHLKNIRGMVQKALMDVNNDEFIIESLGLNDDSIFYELAYDVYHELYNTDFIKKKMEKDVETYYDLIINDMIPGESITEENQESLLIDLIDTFEMNLDKADTIM